MRYSHVAVGFCVISVLQTVLAGWINLACFSRAAEGQHNVSPQTGAATPTTLVVLRRWLAGSKWPSIQIQTNGLSTRQTQTGAAGSKWPFVQIWANGQSTHQTQTGAATPTTPTEFVVLRALVWLVGWGMVNGLAGLAG